MVYDLSIVGDKLWQRFNASKPDLKWYYSSIAEALSPISDLDMYQELKDLIEEVF